MPYGWYTTKEVANYFDRSIVSIRQIARRHGWGHQVGGMKCHHFFNRNDIIKFAELFKMEVKLYG